MRINWQKYRFTLLIIFVFCMTATFSFISTSRMDTSSAVTTLGSSGFNPGNIINDATMSNYNSMTVDEIQNFLTSKNSCNNRNEAYWRQLEAQYPELDWHFENGHFVCLSEERFGDTWTEIGTGQTAAEIIYEAAQDYQINPQVLLVLLEKEQSLISDTFPNNKQYRSATGYGCPDTAACSSKYYGFKNQIRNAAALFRNVLDHGYSVYPEKTPGVYIGYHPNSACGRSEVYIENRATAALYRYTPYQPNAAALNAGYGTGDSCSAYGNRNFYLYFTNWFGSTQTKVEGEQIVIPDGEYSILPADSNQLAILATGIANASNVQIGEFDLSNQLARWQFTYDQTNKSYHITNVASGKRLDVNSQAANAGANIQIYESDSTCGQRWKLYRLDDGSLTFESDCSANMVLDLSSGARIGTNAQLGLVSKTASSQKWQLRVGRTLADGLYLISTADNVTSVIDANGTQDGSNISIWGRHEDSNQEWLANYDEQSDTYTFSNPLSGKRLDLYGGVSQAHTNIQLWSANGTCAQQWKVIKQGRGYILLSACASGYVISLVDNNTNSGTNVELAPYNRNSGQWLFHAASARPATERNYVISAKGSNNAVLDFSSNDHNLLLWAKHGGWNQRWQLIYHSDTDDYTLANPTTREAIDIEGNKIDYGTNLLLWPYHGACNQRWKINRTSDGYYEIISACDDRYALDLYGNHLANGTNVQLWPRHGGDAQKFVFSY